MRTDKFAKTPKQNGLMEPLTYGYPNALSNE